MTTRPELWIGIDVGKTAHHACAVDNAGKTIFSQKVGNDQAAIEAVIARLTESHLIDDKRYAQRLAETSAHKPVGIYAMKRKLRAKGISEEDAEDALDVFDEDQQRTAAKAAAEKLGRKYLTLPAREGKAKLSQALARRGFSWDVVREAVEHVFSDDEWE